MNEIIAFILAGLQITLFDILLSGDNVGVIALAIQNLNPKDAKKASIIGVSGAIVLRIIFACIVTLILKLSWLHIQLIGGILLLKITWDLVSQAANDKEEVSNVKSTGSMFKAVMSIIIADVSMSLDNVLAIGSTAHGNIGLIAFGIILNIPIIFFGSQYVAGLMKKHKIVIYAGAALLVHTAISMIFEDGLFSSHLNHLFSTLFPWAIAVGVMLLGFIKLNNSNASTQGKSA